MALTKAQLVDMNANELILDLDADTSLHASTDDQIDIKIGGADDFRFTANTFTALAGSTITGPTIVGSTSVQTPLIEFTDGDDAMTIADGGVVTFAQAPVFPDGSLAVIDLDIDGATDIGAAIVDADLFIIDDGAGGTNRKTAASRLKTYIGGDAGGFPLTALDIDGGTDIGAAIVDADLFVVDDGAGGTNRKTAASRLLTYTMTGTLSEAAQTNITTLGTLSTLTIDNVIINGSTIGHTGDTDLITVADGALTVAGTIGSGAITSTSTVTTTGLIIGSTAVTSTAAELNLLDDKDATHLAVPGKIEGTNFQDSLLVGHATTGTLNNAIQNTGVGIEALQSLTSGDNNTTLGRNAGRNITSANNNTAVGGATLRYLATGSGRNTAIGYNVLTANDTSFEENTGIGSAALQNCTGNVNIAIGYKAGNNITSGNGNVIIGEVDADSATGDRQLKITGHDGSTRTTWISGDSSGNLTFAANATIGGNLILGSATVTEAQLEILDGATITTTELNLIDGGATVGTTAFADGDGILHNDGGAMKVTSATTLKTYMSDLTLTTAAQTNITSLGTLTALTVDNMVHNGDAIVMTPSTNDTVTMTAATNGAFSLVTVDTAAAAANVQITADGTFEVDATTITLDSAGDILFDAAGNNITLASGGTSYLDFINSSGDAIIKTMVDAKDIIFQQYDGTEVLRVEDGGLVDIVQNKLAIGGTAVTSTAAELNKLDGATVTTAEINYSDLATLGTTAASKVFTADANNLTKVSGAVLNTEDTLSDGANIAWNVINSPVAKVTLAGNRNLSAPSGSTPAAGQFVSLLVIQDGTGSRTLAFNAVYEFTGNTAPTLTATADLGDLFVFRYNGAKWLETGRNLALVLS